MEKETSANPNRTWLVGILAVTIVCGFLFLSVFVVAAAYLATGVIPQMMESEQRNFVDVPNQTTIRVVDKSDRPAAIGPRDEVVDADETAPDGPNQHQNDQPVAATAIDRTSTELDSKDATLDHMAKQLAMRLRSAKPDQQAQLLRELEILIEQHFEYRQQQRKHQLDRLSVRIDALRVLQRRRQENKAEVLKRRLKDLTDPNGDLNWEDARTADGSISGQDGEVADRIVPKPANPDQIASTASQPVVEKTFDGTPYSQWLKMLETERKPEKLATAIDACSRLAEPADERRIIHGILIAASVFETGDTQDRAKVWNAGWTGLNRRMSTVVVEELINALRDQASYKSGRQFQTEYLATKSDPEVDDALKTHADVLIGELIRLSSNADKDRESCLAAACAVWQDSKRPLDDFEQLKSRLLKMIDDGPSTALSTEDFSPWSFVMIRLTWLAPETPGLALMLVKHVKNGIVVFQLGEMGRHAEPAVPALVDLFLVNWRNSENRRRESEMTLLHPDPGLLLNPADMSIIESLGKIGVGAKGYALLRQLAFFFDLPRGKRGSFLAQWAVIVEKALLQFESATDSVTRFDLLSDRSLIHGRWDVRSVAPSGTQDGMAAIFHYSQIQLVWDRRGVHPFTKLIGGLSIETNQAPRFELDDATTPKRICVFCVKDQLRTGGGEIREVPNSRHFGIYELTQTTLRMQFALLGKPYPAELVADKSELSEGQYLLEFDRKLDEELEKVGNPK